MDWQVFQTDVLDSLEQYKGYFDLFERIGSLSDNSRPDCVAKVSRNRKKIWIFDAKNKRSIDDEDERRMQDYKEKISANPLEIGLNPSEVKEYELEPVFITQSNCNSKFTVVPVKSLHQYLRKELVYVETDKVVRDVAGMAKNGALSHGQVRLLYRSLTSFRGNMQRSERLLQDLENSFTGLKLHGWPRKELEHLPVDFVIEHEERPEIFLVDVPYSDHRLEEQDLPGLEDKEVIYTVLGGDSEYGCKFEEFENRLKRKAGILGWRDAVELFSPRISTEVTFDSDKVVVRDDIGLGFRAEIKSLNDTEYRIKAQMPQKALKRLKERNLNSRKDFGEIRSNCFIHQFKVEKELEIDYGVVESFEAYRDTVDAVYQSALSPYLSKKVSST